MLRINDPVLIYQGKFVHAVKLSDLSEKAAQRLLGFQIVVFYDTERIFHIGHISFQFLRNHLGPPSRQLFQIKFADPVDGLTGPHPCAV